MTTPIKAAMFVVIWFLVLFTILPIGVRSQHEAGEVQAGTDPGAPVAPRLLIKALWTTGVAIVIFAGLLVFIAYEG